MSKTISIDITAKNTELAPKVRNYATKRFAALEKFIARKHREGTHIEAVLTEAKSKSGTEYVCSVVLRTPVESFEAKETNLNFYAAIDVAENKLKTQLRKHKETHRDPKTFRRVFSRALRRGEEVR